VKREVALLIELSYLGNHQSFKLEEAMNLLIVRRPPAKIPEHFIHVPQLSPSNDLFQMAQIWKKQLGDKENWFPLYEERFLKEIKERDDLVRALRKLEKRIEQGMDIRLFCYCKDHHFCHRKYIGEELEKRGHAVDWCKKETTEQLSLF
jgi:uncharacterized protein YeaO (DUF488 family)